MVTEGERPRASFLARFGLFEPVQLGGPSSTAARALLGLASRSAEIGLHRIRGLVWIFAIVGIATWSGAPIVAAAVGIALGGIWLVTLVSLQRASTFNTMRLVLLGLDALFIVLAIAASDAMSPVHALLRVLAPNAPPPDVSAYVVPLLAMLAFSGAIRLDMKIAALITLVALAVYAYDVVAFRPGADEAVFLGGVVFAAGVIGMNGVWLLRQTVLHLQERTLLEAFVPEELTKDLPTVNMPLDRAGRVEELTLLTCDIRGFTTMSQKLSPPETVEFINAYLEIVCPAIVGAGGVIDKFMGDGVLSFFEGGGHAGRALNASRLIASVSGKVQTKLGDPIRIGVAVHTGQVLVGTVGPRSKREYTIISDTVNTLSRLEELNKKFGSAICVSESTLAEVRPEQRTGFYGPEAVPIRGRAGYMNVYYYKAETQEALDELKKAADATPMHETPQEQQTANEQKEQNVVYWSDAPKT